MRFFGIRHSRSFPSVSDLLGELQPSLNATAEPVYLSIDKDVLAPDVAQTNWDQGVMQLEELTAAIEPLRERIIGSDVVGDVSSYQYRSRLKRLLSGLDHQPPIPDDRLGEWQARHQQINLQLLALLAP